jgi:hypothetical protein
MKNILLAGLIILLCSSGYSQCVADYDFGDDPIGIAPDPYQGETFAPAILGEPYADVLHMLIPEFVLEVDATLPFSPTTTLDSVQLISMVMVDLDDPLTLYSPDELGLEITCYNNGDSSYPCTFLGNNQYCATVTGSPTTAGHFRADITIKGYVLVFGFPFGQEQLFGSLIINMGVEGCMDQTATNYNPEAVIDDGSCFVDTGIEGCMDQTATNYNPEAVIDDGSCLGCYGDLDGDFSVAIPDVLSLLIAYGCVEECSIDLNGDGQTTVSDMLALLTVYGNICFVSSIN